jgi:hypothetical protein
MFRLLFWIIVLALVGLVLNGNLPVPGIPQEEVVFTTDPPVASCGSSGCIVVYSLDVANTGESAQESVRVRLRAEPLAQAVVVPTVRRATETSLAPSMNDRQGIDVYPLGRLAPEERAALVFALRAASRETVLGWERLLIGVEPALGAARPGDVSEIGIGRLLHSTSRTFRRVVATIRQAIASK